MTAPTVRRRQQLETGTDTTNIRYNISEAITLLDPFDTPTLDLVGINSLRFPCDQIKHEWLTDRLRPRETTLAVAYTAGSGTLTVASDAGKYFYRDDMLLIGANVLQILSGPPDSDTFVVQGGVGDSTDADAAAGATVRKIAPALPEGSVSRMDATKTVIGRPYNYTQIFRDQVPVSGTMRVIKRYGYVSERAYQEEKILTQLALDMEMALLYGVKFYSEGPPRRSSLGGLFDFIYLAGVSGSWDTVVDLDGAELTEDRFNAVLQAIWEQGGKPDAFMVNGFNKRVVTKWATPRIRTELEERTAGASIGRYVSDFGTLDIVLNRWLRTSDVPIITRGDIGFGPLEGRPLTSREVPSLGDYDLWEVLGEYTAEVFRASMAHGWIYNTSTS